MSTDVLDVDIKVTKIGNKWHARLLYGTKILDEMACINRQDIGWICREMLRWYVKNGGCSKFASAARARQKNGFPLGRVWYYRQLKKETQRR